MSEFLPNCIGYAYFEKGILRVERYQKPPIVAELPGLFTVEHVISPSSEIITVVRGNKKANESAKLLHKVEHMISIDNGEEYCSHREREGGPIDYGSAKQLLEKYFDDRGLFYFLYLTVRK